MERAVFVSLAFAAFFVAVASTQEAFADSAPVLQHTAPGQVHYRDVSESLAVASLFDSPSQPRIFTRSLNDGLSVSTGFNTPAQQAQTYGPVQQRANGSPTPVAMQRTDERLTFKSIGKLATTSTAGTPYNSAVSPFSGQQQVQTDEQADQALQEILNASGDGTDPDSSSQLLDQMTAYSVYLAMEKSAQNAILINAGTSAVLLAGALVVLVARQPAVSEGRARKRLLALFVLKHSARAGQAEAANTSVTYALVLVFAIFATSSLVVSVVPSVGQEYADSSAKTNIELSTAYHLDSEGNPVSDITSESSELDGIWSDEVPDGHYVRVNFARELNSARDITIFARIVSGDPKIQVYEVGGTELVAEFAPLALGQYNKVFLTNLKDSQKAFDLRVSGGSVEFDHIIDPSPVPTYVGDGGQASGTGTITPALPAGIQENDVLLLFVETANQTVTITNSNGGTWTQVTNSPQGTGTAGGTSATALTVFWSRYDGVQGAPTVGSTTNHKIGVILAFRGVITSGDPWSITSGGVESTADTSGSIPGATTTTENTLVVMAIATSLPDANGTTNFSGWANANLANVTERFDVTRNAGNGGGLGVATGEKATASAYGASSVTVATSAAKGMMTIALRPPLPAPPTLSISQPDGVGDTISRSESYTITYTLSDPDDDVTVAFYYDTDSSGLDGTAISGACATAPEGTNVTCEWDTTGLVIGTYYVYGIANDGNNPAVSAYSPGAITIDRTPFFVGAGAAASAAGAITPTLPSGIEADDILLLFVETADQAVTLSDQNGGTWTEVANSPQGASAGTLATSTRLTVFWSRYNGLQGDPTVANSGNHNLGVVLAFRGVAATGDPWDVTSGNSESTSDASLAATGATTMAANTLVVIAAALMDDAQDFGATWTNTDLSNITVRANEGTAAGNDGRLGVVTGKKITVGTYGDTTNTLTASSVKGMMTIALKPLPSSRDTSDSLSVSDSITAKLTGKAVSQSLSVADSIVAKITGKAVGQSLGVSDSIDAQKTVIPDTNVAAMAYRSDTGVDGTSSPKYREWNPTIKEWGSEVELESAGSPIRNAWLEWSSVSTKRVIVVLSADGTLDSYVCDNDCTTPGNWTVTHDFADLWSVEPAATWRPFDMEYEKTSGDLVIVYDRVSPGSNTADLFYRIMPDSSHTFGDESSFNDIGSIIPENVYSFVRLDSRRTTGSNDLGLVALSSTNSRAAAWYWNGATDTFGDYKELTTSASSTNYESIGIAFETFTGDLIAVAGQGNDVMYSEFSSGSWSSMAKVMTPSGDDIDVGTVRWIRLVGNDNPGTTVAFLAVSGYDGFVHMLDSADWSGTAWEVYGLGTRHDAAIDTSETRVFDYAWDNSDAAFRGILVWATSSGLISFKKHSTPSAWTSTITVSDDGTTHPWIALNEKSNPTASDAVSVLGAVMDDGADISPIVWYGLTSNVASLGDDGITTEGNASSESFRTDFRRSSMVKKFPLTVLTVTDSVVARLSAKVFTDSVTVGESAIGEKGSPASSSAAAAVYRSNTGTHTLNSPKYREWDPATQTWSAEVELPNTGSPVRDAKIRFSPETAMRIVISQSADGTLNLYKCDDNCTSASSWALVAADFADTGLVDANKYYRAYDVLFSTQSETAMIVYDKEDTDDNDFWYRTYDGTTLSEEFGFNLGGSADAEEIRYLRLAANPSSEEMALVLINSNALSSYTLIWDGSSWGNQQLMSNVLNADNRDGESIGIAYEKSGAALAISANGQNSIKYSRWNGSSWTTPTHTDPNPPDTGEFVKFVTVKPDPAPGSTKVMVCQSDQLSDLSCSLFDAGTPGTWNMITTNVGTTSGRAFDFVYHPSGTTGVLVSSSGASGTLDYRTFDGTSFAGPYSVSAAGTHKWVYGASAPAADDVVNALFVKSNSNFDSGALKFKAQIVSAIGDASLTSDSFNDTYESIHIDFQLSKLRKRAISDSIAVTDAIALTPGKSLSDSVGVSDSIVAKITARAIADQLTVTDSVSAKITARAISDTLSVSDSVVAKLGAITISQALDIDDAITKSVTRAVSDSLTVTDSTSAGVGSVFGVDYRRLVTTPGVLNTDTSVQIATTGAANYIIDPYTTISALTGTPSNTTPSGYGWRTTGAVGEVVPAGTWTFDIETNTSGVTLGTGAAFLRVYAYSTDIVGGDVQLIGTVTSATDLLTLTGGTVSHTLTFAGAETDLTNRVLVVEYWIIVTQAPTLAATTAFHTVSDVNSVELPSSTIYYLSTPRLHSMGIEESIGIADDMSLFYDATRPIQDNISVTDAITFHVTKSTADAIAVTDTMTIHVTRPVQDSLGVTDVVVGKVTARVISDQLAVTDTISAKITGTTIPDSLSITDSVTAKITARAINDSLGISDSITAKITGIMITDSLNVADTLAGKVTRRVMADSVSVTDAITAKVTTRTIADQLSVTDSISAKITAVVVSDELQVTDTLTAKVTARAINDALAVTDAISAKVTKRVISDDLAVTDTIAAKVTARALADALSVQDAIVAKITGVGISETLAITDDVVAKITGISITDSIGVTDTLTGKVTRRVIADSVTIEDEIATAKVFDRPVEDSLQITDAIAKSVSKDLDDEFAIADAVSTRVTRSIEEELEVTDSPGRTIGILIDDAVTVTDFIAKATIREISDSVQVTDAIPTRVSRELADELVIEDISARSVTLQIADSVSIEDSPAISQNRQAQETLDIDDEIAKSVTKQAADDLLVTDAISTSVTRSVSDTLGVASQAVPSIGRTIGDSLDVEDSVSKSISKAADADSLDIADSISIRISRSVSDDIEVSDEIDEPTIFLDDEVGITDAVSKVVVKTVADSVQMTDEVTAKITGVTITETVTVDDKIQEPGPRETIVLSDDVTMQVHYMREMEDSLTVEAHASYGTRDSIKLDDSVSINVGRFVYDDVVMQDNARRGFLRLIDDTLGILESMFITIDWTRNFDESLSLGATDCYVLPTYATCTHDPVIPPQGLGLEDEVELVIIPPPELEDAVLVSDQITLGLKVSAVPPIVQLLAVTDSLTAQIIGILVVETKESIGPLPSTTVTGTYTYTGNASDLKNSVIPVPIPINATVVKPALPNQITILRTYSVPVAWTPEIPTNNVIMSESQLEVPAYSNMFMRLNFNDTPALSPHKDFISMLDIEFTPKVDATDFGLVVTPTDKPAAAPTPADELKPLYLDVRWWGTFPGVEDPAVQDYYQNPPSFTFTVNDQWVADNNAERDSQGWPSLKLWLLNEGTNQWEQITSITKVSAGGDGTYTYTATLPHFSNYAITANVSAGGPVAPPPAGPSIPVQLPTSYTVLLADDLGMQEGTKMSAVTIIEEFLQPKKVSVFLSDLVSVSTKPVALPTEIKVDKDVTVKISLEEVKQSNLTDPGAVIDAFTNPSALADIEVVITNTGEEDRQFEFIFTYNDAKGNLHSQSAVLDVDANSTISRFVELPFTEPGVYVITVEVRNLPGGDLAGFSTLTIEIPWLGLYLYTMLGVAGAILGISGIAIAIYMLQRPEIPIAAGAGGAGLLAAAYRKKTKIRLFARDEEEFKKDHRYQVLARLELRKVVSAGSQLKAVFALDIWSKKDGREFVVTYRAINALGVVVHESHILVPAMPDLQSLSIVMPFASSGHYTIQAEARPELEGDVLDKSELPVQINVQ